ncbi:MAG: DUF302 domain-containing protein [Terriglobia bacterium]|nr:DUF302 domain-containing protein [Terriglobia bacterium]
MTYSKHSSRSPEEVGDRLQAAAQRHKFGVLHVLDLKTTLHTKGIEINSECRIYDVCNPQAAAKALRAEMKASTVLPCRISVFSDETGCTIATVKPTDLLKATGLAGVDALAKDIEQDILAMIDEAA